MSVVLNTEIHVELEPGLQSSGCRWDLREQDVMFVSASLEFRFTDFGSLIISGAEHFPLLGTDNLLTAESWTASNAAFQLSDVGKSSACHS